MACMALQHGVLVHVLVWWHAAWYSTRLDSTRTCIVSAPMLSILENYDRQLICAVALLLLLLLNESTVPFL